MENYYSLIRLQKFSLVDGFGDSYPINKKCYVKELENGFILFTGFMDIMIDYLVFDKKKKLISMIDGINFITPIENFDSFVFKTQTEDFSTIKKT